MFKRIADQRLIGYIVPMLVVVTFLFFQAGYSNLCAYLISFLLLLCSCVLMRDRDDFVPLYALIPFFPLVILTLSSIFHQSLTLSIDCMSHYCLFAASILFFSLGSIKDLIDIRSGFIAIGIAASLSAILIFILDIPIPGFSVSGRLFGYFQYANTCGIWFAIIGLLCLGSNDKRINVASLLPLVALLLTKSVSAICLTIISCTVVLLKKSELGRSFIFIFLGALVVVISFAVFNIDRLLESTGTFVERLIQYSDSLTLLGQSPELGIAPGLWKYEYHRVQTAQYTANVPHSVIIQILLDSGCLGLSFYLIFFGLVIFSLYRARNTLTVDFSIVVSLFAFLVHSVIDFDFSFGLIDFFAAYLFVVVLKECQFSQDVRIGHLVSFLAPAILVVCIGSFLRFYSIDRGLMISPFYSKDPEVVYNYALRLSDEGQYYSALDYFDGYEGLLTDDLRLIRAGCLYCVDNDSEAEKELLDTFAYEPLNRSLYEQIDAYFDYYGISDSGLSNFNDIKTKANELLKRKPALYLKTQKLY